MRLPFSCDIFVCPHRQQPLKLSGRRASFRRRLLHSFSPTRPCVTILNAAEQRKLMEVPYGDSMSMYHVCHGQNLSVLLGSLEFLYCNLYSQSIKFSECIVCVNMCMGYHKLRLLVHLNCIWLKAFNEQNTWWNIVAFSARRELRVASLRLLQARGLVGGPRGSFWWSIAPPKHFWLVVWNMFYFSILGIITPTDWYFSEGLKPPTRFYWEKWWLNGLFNEILWVDESYYPQVTGWLVADPFQVGT